MRFVRGDSGFLTKKSSKGNIFKNTRKNYNFFQTQLALWPTGLLRPRRPQKSLFKTNHMHIFFSSTSQYHCDLTWMVSDCFINRHVRLVPKDERCPEISSFEALWSRWQARHIGRWPIYPQYGPTTQWNRSLTWPLPKRKGCLPQV